MIRSFYLYTQTINGYILVHFTVPLSTWGAPSDRLEQSVIRTCLSDRWFPVLVENFLQQPKPTHSQPNKYYYYYYYIIIIIKLRYCLLRYFRMNPNTVLFSLLFVLFFVFFFFFLSFRQTEHQLSRAGQSWNIISISARGEPFLSESDRLSLSNVTPHPHLSMYIVYTVSTSELNTQNVKTLTSLHFKQFKIQHIKSVGKLVLHHMM